MRKWIEEWIEDRTGLSKLLKVMLDEPVHGGAKWSYIFGSGLVFLFILQAATGMVLSGFYSPSSTSAWGERLLHSTQNVLWLVCTRYAPLWIKRHDDTRPCPHVPGVYLWCV